jgi:hypothetical protein
MPTGCERRPGPGRRLLGAIPIAAALLVGCDPDDPTGPARPPNLVMPRLTAPAALRAVPAGPKSVLVTWAPVGGADRYRVERAVAKPLVEFRLVSDTVIHPGLRDEDLHRSLGYLYRVAAIRDGETSPFSDSVVVFLDLRASVVDPMRATSELVVSTWFSQLPAVRSLPGRYGFVSRP